VASRVEEEIFGIFCRDITLALSINQIASRLQKAYPHVYSVVISLIREGILNKAQVGRSYLCSINLKNENAVLLLSLAALKRRDMLLKRKKIFHVVENFKNLSKEFKIYTAAIHNDMLHIVLDYKHDSEAIKAAEPSLKRYRLRFYTKEEFIKNCEDFKSSVIVYSFTGFYNLIADVLPKIRVIA